MVALAGAARCRSALRRPTSSRLRRGGAGRGLAVVVLGDRPERRRRGCRTRSGVAAWAASRHELAVVVGMLGRRGRRRRRCASVVGASASAASVSGASASSGAVRPRDRPAPAASGARVRPRRRLGAGSTGSSRPARAAPAERARTARAISRLRRRRVRRCHDERTSWVAGCSPENERARGSVRGYVRPGSPASTVRRSNGRAGPTRSTARREPADRDRRRPDRLACQAALRADPGSPGRPTGRPPTGDDRDPPASDQRRSGRCARRRATQPRRPGAAPASSAAPTGQARAGPRRTATDDDPAARSRSTSTRALAIARPAPASDGRRDEDANTAARIARGAEPTEDRQDRDPDRERQPGPGRALSREVVGQADRDDDDRDGRQAQARPGAPAASARPTPTAARGRPGGRRSRRVRPGSACPALRPASCGASTRSFRAPIPSLERRSSPGPIRIAGPSGAPATIATPPLTSAVEERREGMDRGGSRPATRGEPSPSGSRAQT